MTGVPRPDLAADLDREWRTLAVRRGPIERAHGWRLATEPFEDLHELLALAGFAGLGRVNRRAEANAVLGDLVDVAHHDQLACRIVLQRILPGLLAACSRWRRGCPPAGVTPDELFGELVAVGWMVIRSYRTATRPRHVAHNLLGDTVYRTFVAPSRRLAAGEQPHRFQYFRSIPADECQPAIIELAGVVHDARRAGIAEEHLALLCDLLRAGGSAARVATDYCVTDRTIRTRRAKAIAAVRAVALAA